MIPVYVCVAGSAEPLPECLAALPEPRVIRAATVAAARAVALAEADADVIAFVDGDVVVGERWAERLAAAWRGADWQIGAIGGPSGGSGRDVAATADWGDKQLDVDPLERTLPGGNLSFRRRALLGVGGFGTTPDGHDARDWLAEEHEAQRQLGHWGWLLRYEPGLRASRSRGWKDAPRGGRFRYGVRLGMTGNRPAREAAPALGRALAATAMAAARRNRANRSASASRAAENAGALLAPIAGRRSDVPASELARLSPKLRSVRPSSRGTPPFILLYHRVAADAPDPLKLCVSPRHFEEQLAVLQEDFAVVSMDAMAAERPAGAVAITFDDGYEDNVAALGGIEIPVTLYAATGHIAEARPFFWDELGVLFEEREHVQMRDLHFRLQPADPDTIERTLTGLRVDRRAHGQPPALMSVGQLRELAARGVDIGAHTVRHLNLAHQRAAVLEAEVIGSRDDVAAWTGALPRGFSYPFGIPRHDVDAAAMKAVREAGFDYAVVNQPTPVLPESDRFALPRLFAPDCGGAELRAWLRGTILR